MDLDVIAHNEFHARKSHAVGWQPPPAVSGSRVREVEHDVGAGLRHGAQIELPDFNGGRAFVDETLVALRARRCILGFESEVWDRAEDVRVAGSQ